MSTLRLAVALMAWVIIGGLLTSTFLARLVTPVIYKLFTPDVEEKPAPFA